MESCQEQGSDLIIAMVIKYEMGAGMRSYEWEWEYDMMMLLTGSKAI